MKTKIFGFVAIVCIAFAASFITNKVSKSSSALSMLAAANVEALAENPADPNEYEFSEFDEIGSSGYTCINGPIYGGVGIARLCPSCGWQFGLAGYSRLGRCL
jgi:hypothetical protein